MTPKRPIELIRASADAGRAWLKRDAMIDAGDTEGVKAMDLTCAILDARYNSLYQQWQILGGTSNIQSIALPLPAEHYEKDFTPFSDAWTDPRTPEQIAHDEFSAEVEDTRRADYPI